MKHDPHIFETCLFSRKTTYIFMLIMVLAFIELNSYSSQNSIPSYLTVQSKFFKRPSLTLSSDGFTLYLFFHEEAHMNIIVQKTTTSNADDRLTLKDQPIYFNNSQFAIEFTSLLKFKIIRSQTSETLFELQEDMSVSDSMFKSKIRLPTDQIFGLDEASLYKSLTKRKFKLFDSQINPDPRKSQSNFPMYLVKENSGFYHIGHVDSIQYQEIELDDDNIVNWDLMDNAFNFHMIIGDKYPENSLKTYRKYFGNWKPPQLWAFGFFQSRELYTYIELIELVKSYVNLKIPLEALITNISPEDDCKMPYIHKYMPAIYPFLDGNGVRLLPLVNSPKEYNSVFSMQSYLFDCRARQPFCEDSIRVIPKPRLNRPSKFIGAIFSDDYHRSKENYNFEILQDSHVKLEKSFKSEFFISKTSISHSSQTSSHWIANLDFSWESLRETLKRVLNYNIFGIPYVGGDICGSFFGPFHGKGTELCLRWYQMAAFLPFMVNSYQNIEEHRTFKELTTFAGDLQKAISGFLFARYGLAQQIHTYFLLNQGSTIIKPLSFLYPEDPVFGVYGSQANEEQFMIGDSLMIAPCLYGSREQTEVMLPKNTTWFDLRTFARYNNSRANVSTNLTEIAPYFITVGTIVFRQETEELLLERLSAKFDIIISIPSVHKLNLTKPFEVKGQIAYSVNQTDFSNRALESYLTRLRAVITSNDAEKSFNISLIFSSDKFPIQFHKVVFLSSDPKFSRYGDIKSSQFKKSEMKILANSHMIKLEFPLKIAENNKQFDFIFRKISI